MIRSAANTQHPPPSLRFEQAFWGAGLRVVVGVDEVGRGALAGPLVAAAIVLPACTGKARARLCAALAEVRDSKLLSPAKRENVASQILGIAAGVGIGNVPSDELDAIGVGPANRQAMERAIAALPVVPEAALLDACVLDLGLPQVGLIDGDALCLSIAAASIVAKVTRDRWMTEAHELDPRYGFCDHKGYGTAAHLAALLQYGPGPLHRRCFAPVAGAATVLVGR